jgi:hypothetical protein
VPRGPADRPLRKVDDEVALQAAMRRALEQAAAPGEVRFVVPDPPCFGTGVTQTAPVRRGSGVVRSRGARAVARIPRARKKAASPPDPAADPRGRGVRLDLSV